MEKSKEKTCCFFGHRKIKKSEKLKAVIYKTAESLIANENIESFLFGSKSRFDAMCYEVISELKEKYPHIKRIYVRAEFPNIDESYREHLMQFYEDTYYPEKLIKESRASYVERNYEMIDKSSFCIVYYEKSYKPPMRKANKRDLIPYQPKSGTKIAYDYAKKSGVDIINVIKFMYSE